MQSHSSLKILIVDDEPLARERLRTLLSDIAVQLPAVVVGEAGNGLQALEFLRECPVDVVLADIRMPGMDGIELASHLGRLDQAPAVIFTTAYDNYAVQAFDLNAVDYLLKPVRAQRLLAALQKVPAQHPDATLLAGIGLDMRGGGRTHLSCHERGRLLLVPIGEVLYFKADLKYVTARTAEREYLLDEALTHLESEFSDRFLRLHRAVLVAKSALAGFEKAAGDDVEAYGWAILRGVPEKLPVSRRQWAPAKALIKNS
jgi:two-component system response regulator AlgR